MHRNFGDRVHSIHATVHNAVLREPRLFDGLGDQGLEFGVERGEVLVRERKFSGPVVGLVRDDDGDGARACRGDLGLERRVACEADNEALGVVDPH